MKSLFLSLVSIATMAASALAGDVITVNVHGPAAESLWRNAVPEPSAAALSLLAVGGIGLMRRR